MCKDTLHCFIHDTYKILLENSALVLSGVVEQRNEMIVVMLYVL